MSDEGWRPIDFAAWIERAMAPYVGHVVAPTTTDEIAHQVSAMLEPGLVVDSVVCDQTTGEATVNVSQRQYITIDIPVSEPRP